MRLYRKTWSTTVEYYIVHNLGEHFWWWGTKHNGSWHVSEGTWDVDCATSEGLIEVKPLEVLLVTGLEAVRHTPPCPNLNYECRCQSAFAREV
jgi:hypothetical protein